MISAGLNYIEHSRLDRFLAKFLPTASHDLTTSYGEALSVSALLDLAGKHGIDRWKQLALGYGEPNGSLTLRSRVAELYTTISSSNVVCCTGAHDAAASVVNAILAPGDHAIVVLPLYQPLEWVTAAHASVTGVALDPDTLKIDLRQVAAAITPRTRLVLMNFPNSPSGAILDDTTRDGLIALCRHHGLWLVNDEVYSHHVIGKATPPIADLYERGISVDALTKGYGLAGLRVGWVVCPDRAMLRRIAQVKAIRAGYISVAADALATIALANRPCLLDRIRTPCAANRARLLEVIEGHPELFDLGFGESLLFACPRYRGADGPMEFAKALVTRGGVLLLPAVLWRSSYGAIPEDRVRVGLGLSAGLNGLDALADFLQIHARAVARYQ